MICFHSTACGDCDTIKAWAQPLHCKYSLTEYIRKWILVGYWDHLSSVHSFAQNAYPHKFGTRNIKIKAKANKTLASVETHQFLL